jgi:polysaccharide biosynthesis/export protein
VTVTRRLDRGRIPLQEAKDDPSGQFSTAEIGLRPLLDGRAPATDILLQPNDVIAVSRAELVYVIGEVGRAGPLPLVRGNSMSVMEAVSASGGVLRTAKPSEARILRPVPGSETRTEVSVNISKIMAGKANDVQLLAGDILVVPDSPGKRGVAVALQAAIQAGVSIATYGLIR